MPTRLTPCIGFRDNAKEAMEFYQSVFGGELTRSTFAEYQVSDDPAEQDKTMHAQLETPGGMVLMAADTRAAWSTRPGCAATGTSSSTAAPPRCRSRRRHGETASADASPGSA